MTILYTDNFDTDTVGALPAGWTQVSGTTWQVGTTNPNSGPNTFGEATPIVGDLAQYTGIATRGDMVISCTQKLTSLTAGSTYHIGFRTNTGWTNGYQFALAYSGPLGSLAIQFYRKTSGTYTKVTEVSATSLGFAVGDMLNFEVNIVGTVFEFRVWKVATGRPSTPTMSSTDSTYTTGFAGLYTGATTAAGVDDFVIQDALSSAATALTLSGPSTGTTSSPSSNFTVTANGSLSSSVTVTPSDGGGGGTFTPATLTLNSGTLSGTFTYTAAANGAHAISLSNTGSLSNPSAATYTSSSSAATTVTLSGPTTGASGVASSAFTVGANGAITGTVVVTPSDGGAGGTFSPTTVSISNGSPTGTFTYTPSAAGTDVISVTNNGSLTNPSSINYVATAVVTFPVTNANIFFSPYNWYSDGAGSMQANNVKGSSTYAWSNNRGAYMRFKATVGASGTIKLNVNTSSLASVANAAGCPNLAWSVGGGAEQSVLLASGNTQVALATGLTAGTYEVFLAFRSVFITQDGDIAGCYTTPNNRVQVTGVELSSGGTLSAPTLKSKRMLIYGDSITEGDRSMALTRSATSQDAKRTYGWYLAEALDAEIGIVGWYGQQWSFLVTSWDHYSSANSRLNGGLLLPGPDYVFINYGENDGNPGPATTVVNPFLTSLAAAAPGAKIILNIPFSGKARTNLALATLPTGAIRTDLNRSEMASGNLQWSFDGQHPSTEGHPNLASLLANVVRTAYATGSGSVQGIGVGGLGLTATGQLVALL